MRSETCVSLLLALGRENKAKRFKRQTKLDRGFESKGLGPVRLRR